MPSSSPSRSQLASIIIIIITLILLLLIIIILTVLSISSNTWWILKPITHPTVQIHSADVINVFPHDPNAFTQKKHKKCPPSLSPHRPSPSRLVSIIIIILILLLYIITVLSISSNTWWVLTPITHPTVQIYSADVHVFPHDPNVFTQGLLYAGNDTLFESTGIHGQSSVRKVALRTGKVEALHKMADLEFGEGLTMIGQRLYQVTWQKKTGFIYDPNNLNKLGKFTHQMQDGWGLATDGQVIFGSDGTSKLYHIDPQTLKVIKSHTIKYKEHEVHNLNELEYVNGEIWANVWMTDCIARISPKDGFLLGWILLPKLREGLLRPGNIRIDVLNGIAWDSEKDRIFVTGKLWPKLFEIKLRPSDKLRDGVVEQMCLTKPFKFVKS